MRTVAARTGVVGALLLLLVFHIGCRTAPTDPVEKDLAALEHESAVTRAAACHRLGSVGDRRAVPALIGLLDDPSTGVRVAAVDALGRLGDPQAVPGLLLALRDQDPTVRGRALIALGQIGGAGVAVRVAPHLDDPDAGVRVCAVKALGAVGATGRGDAIRALLDRTPEDPDHVLLSTAIVALTQIEGRSALPELFRRAGDAEAFDSWLVLSSLAWAAGESGDRERIPFLRRWQASDDERVAGAAATALVRLGEAEPVLADLEDADPIRRRLATAALMDGGGDRYRDRVVSVLDDPSWRVRLEAAIGLSQQGVPESFPVLVEGLSSPSALIWGSSAGELVRRYGVDHGRQPEVWISWYRDVRDRLVWDPDRRVWRHD